MRLFFINWSGKDLGLVDVVRELKKNHQIVYWTCANAAEEVDAAEFAGTILHDHFEALRGEPAKELAGEQFSPPSEELLKKLYEAESIVLTMMNKLFEAFSVSERKYLYHSHVKYWNGVLQKYRPEAIIFPTIPHTDYDFVIYALAKIYKIKTVMMEPTWIGDRMVVMNDYIDGPQGFIKITETLRNQKPSLGAVSGDLRGEYESQAAAKQNDTTVFVKNIRKQYSGIKSLKIKARSFWTTITVLKDFSVFIKIFTYFPRRFRPNQKTEYESVAASPDFGRPFVYLPLHYQPERNSSPQGGVFVDQILMAETLSSALPDGWMLYIKEHPTQWFFRGPDYFSYRFRGYYQAMARLKNVRIVPMETSSYELISRSRAVATITGTAGWEAVLRRKPVLIFGYAWYRNAPGIFRIWDAASCRAALEKIKQNFSVSEEEVIKYLQILGKATFRGYIDLDGRKASELSPGENAVNLTSAILSCL